VPRRLTTGRLVRLLTFSAQHTKLKRNRWLELGARTWGYKPGQQSLNVGTSNVVGTVSLVRDLRITHERFGGSFDPNLNGHLHYPNDIDRSLIEAVADKIRKYRADYNNNLPTFISFTPTIASTSEES
jgi:hypothetical protein